MIPIEYSDIMPIITEGSTDYFWVQKDNLWGIYSIETHEVNPDTGVTAAIIPAIIAATAAIITKKSKRVVI
jgi:hypothetical protein